MKDSVSAGQYLLRGTVFVLMFFATFAFLGMIVQTLATWLGVENQRTLGHVAAPVELALSLLFAALVVRSMSRGGQAKRMDEDQTPGADDVPASYVAEAAAVVDVTGPAPVLPSVAAKVPQDEPTARGKARGHGTSRSKFLVFALVVTAIVGVAAVGWLGREWWQARQRDALAQYVQQVQEAFRPLNTNFHATSTDLQSLASDLAVITPPKGLVDEHEGLVQAVRRRANAENDFEWRRAPYVPPNPALGVSSVPVELGMTWAQVEARIAEQKERDRREYRAALRAKARYEQVGRRADKVGAQLADDWLFNVIATARRLDFSLHLGPADIWLASDGTFCQ